MKMMTGKNDINLNFFFKIRTLEIEREIKSKNELLFWKIKIGNRCKKRGSFQTSI